MVWNKQKKGLFVQEVWTHFIQDILSTIQSLIK